MAINIHTTGIELTEEENTYANEKAEKVLHMSKKAENDESIRVNIEVSKENGKDKLEQFSSTFTIFLPGKTLRGESTGSSVLGVIDDAYHRVRKQMEKEVTTHKHI